MVEYEILAVRIVSGESLNPSWHTKMQIIETDKGKFLDNIPTKQFGFFKKAKPGYDWNTLIGKKVRNVKKFDSKAFNG